MHSNDEKPPHLTEADRVSHTRFGPRPVPEGHIPAGSRARPARRGSYQAPLSTRIIVWGGVALGVAGATAAALTAARKIADMTATPHPARPMQDYYGDRMTGMAPRFAELDEADREAMRKRVRAQAREDAREAARQRAEAGRRRDPAQGSGNFARDLTKTAGDLSTSIEGVANSLVKAFTSFRGVAAQAADIVSEFAASADQIRSALGRDRATGSRPTAPSRRAASADDRADTDDRLHRL